MFGFVPEKLEVRKMGALNKIGLKKKKKKKI